MKRMYPKRKPRRRAASADLDRDFEALQQQTWALADKVESLQSQIEWLSERQWFGVSPLRIKDLGHSRN